MKLFASLVTLGCTKNLVDSEIVAPQLERSGYSITADMSKASLIFINTCGFLESAVEEAIQQILQAAEMKNSGICECLVVAGCMVQRYGKKLPDLLPEVDLFLGTSHYLEVTGILRAWRSGDQHKTWISTPRYLPDSRTPRARSSTPYSAYIKIAEGCSNRCSFCMIPHLRGPFRSRTREDVLAETMRLDAEGVKEINLIAQDVTAFGSDRGEQDALIPLLESLEGLRHVEWVRILYTYPERITDPLLRTISGSSKILSYLDIPLQHCVPRILQAMRRKGATTPVEALIERIRSHLPDVILRTSLMVGFPGETESEFRTLLRFVENVQFDHVGVFAFSPEAGTHAARLPMQVVPEIKAQRRRLLLDLQRTISKRRLQRFAGKVLPVLIEGHHPETDLLGIGRFAGQAPEVDGTVIITDGLGEVGQIVPARIIATHEYDLEAELLPSCQNEPTACGTTSIPPVYQSKTL